MSLFLATLVTLAFLLTLERMKLAHRAQDVLTRAQDCMTILRDPSLDDRIKEGALRSHAVHLFGLFGLIAGGCIVGLLLPLAAVWLLEQAEIASLGDVISIMGRIDFLVAVMLVGLLMYLRAGRVGGR